MKKEILLGIDVGGTHTDGVAVNYATGEVLARCKVLTTLDLNLCTTRALEGLLENVDPKKVLRVVLSTTLVTNALATNRIEPVGMIVTAGPGIDPRLYSSDSYYRVVRGAIDHRGREVVPLDEAAVHRHLNDFRIKGINVVAIAGKFSVRNPSHENAIFKIADPMFDYACTTHKLSGALNFPRRLATAFLSAGVWRIHNNFIRTMSRAVEAMGITAPLYLLRADGGAESVTFFNPAESALSGPSASIMGIMATAELSGQTVALDIGGTTTDISLFVGKAPLLEPEGAIIGPLKTQIRSLFNRSIPLGGDSVVRIKDGHIAIGPQRLGPAMAYGGEHPTTSDAFVYLGKADGNAKRAEEGLGVLAHELKVTVEELAYKILNKFSELVSVAVKDFLREVNSRPVYTIHELLTGHTVKPHRAIVVGAPAKALSSFLEGYLLAPVQVPPNYDITNAIGAAVSGLNLEVNASADTAGGFMSIPECDVFRSVGADYSMLDLERDAAECLAQMAKKADLLGQAYDIDTTERESFNIIEDFTKTGSVYRLKLKVRPSIVTGTINS